MGGQLDKALALGQRQGMIGGDLTEHVRHAQSFAQVVEDHLVPLPRTAADLGSGGGLPALVLIERWPAMNWLLVEGREKRALFLQRAVRMLGAHDRVQVWTGDAQVAGWDDEWHGQVDLVTARSFGPPSAVAECASAFLRVGGAVVVSEPPPDKTDRWPSTPLASLGLVPANVSAGESHFCVLNKTADSPAEFRSRKAAESHPLF